MPVPPRDPLRAVRSIRLTVGLLVAGGVYAVIAAASSLGFRTPVFLGLMVLFGLNLAACTSHRLAFHSHRHLRDYMPDGIHIGLLILLLGAAGSLLARTEQTLVLSEGDQFAVRGRYELTLEETSQTGDNWVSRFAVHDTQTGDVSQVDTRVNGPFRVAGFTVYQTAWDRVSILTLSDDGGGRYTVAEHEGFQAGEDVYIFERGETGFDLVWYRNDEVVDRRPVAAGQTLGGLTVTGIEEIPRTVVTVVRDPGAVIALVGAIIMSVALAWYVLDRALREETE